MFARFKPFDDPDETYGTVFGFREGTKTESSVSRKIELRGTSTGFTVHVEAIPVLAKQYEWESSWCRMLGLDVVWRWSPAANGVNIQPQTVADVVKQTTGWSFTLHPAASTTGGELFTWAYHNEYETQMTDPKWTKGWQYDAQEEVPKDTASMDCDRLLYNVLPYGRIPPPWLSYEFSLASGATATVDIRFCFHEVYEPIWPFGVFKECMSTRRSLLTISRSADGKNFTLQNNEQRLKDRMKRWWLWKGSVEAVIVSD
jgi:hypothetical protein